MKGEGWSKAANKLIDWLKEIGPSVASVAMLVYRYLKNKVWRLEREMDLKDLELEKHENEKQVESDNKNKTDVDIVRDAVSEGRKLRGGEDS